MNDLIDLALLKESRNLLEVLLERRGLAYFLAREGKQPLFAIEKDKVELVVRSASARLERRGRSVHPRAGEYCRREIRRELIRRVTEAMLRVGY